MSLLIVATTYPRLRRPTSCQVWQWSYHTLQHTTTHCNTLQRTATHQVPAPVSPAILPNATVVEIEASEEVAAKKSGTYWIPIVIGVCVGVVVLVGVVRVWIMYIIMFYYVTPCYICVICMFRVYSLIYICILCIFRYNLHWSLHRRMWHESFIHVTWLIHTCDMTHSYMWHDSFIHVTWLFHTCDMTHSYMWHDSFIHVTWLIHTCDMTHS